MKGRHWYLSALGVALLAAVQASAVDGVAVSCNFTGSDPGLHSNGRIGPIYAYVIKDSKVVESRRLGDGVGKETVVNTTGTMAAYRQQVGLGKGAICVADIGSGHATELYRSSSVLEEGRLAWPKGDWVYFQLGWPKYDTETFQGGDRIRRVNVKTKQAEEWFDFSHAPWYYCFDSSTTRMVVRSMDDGSAPWGQNIKFELKNGKPPTADLESLYGDSWAKFGSLGGYGCGAGLSPSGKYTSNFTSTGHNGWHIRNWSDGNVVATVGVNEFDKWGGQALGGGNFGNKWSANSDEWLCIRQQGKQVLLNWVRKERIVVTQKDNNETGDFWAGSVPATLVRRGAGRRAVPGNDSGRTPRAALDLRGRRLGAEVTSRAAGDTQSRTVGGVSVVELGGRAGLQTNR